MGGGHYYPSTVVTSDAAGWPALPALLGLLLRAREAAGWSLVRLSTVQL